MTRKPRHTASRAAASESLERRRRYSDAANVVREKFTRYLTLGLMSQNARDWFGRLVDELESGE